jgi:hypothetical protein
MRFGVSRLVSAGTAFALGAGLLTASLPSSASAAPARAGSQSSQGDSARTLEAGAQPAAEKAGVRRASCRGLRATIVGNRRSERIVGTRYRDVIVAGRGADTIMGRGGADIICGGLGADVVNGGPGRDRIFGGSGGDMLEGGLARDRLYGGTRRDLCSGERREHRFHFGCESHRDPFGNLVTPPPAQSPRELPRVKARVSTTSDTPKSQAAAEAGYVEAPLVADCQQTYSSRFIRLGQVKFQTYYTNPGTIALRPLYVTYQNGWQQVTAARDWQLIDAPADNQVYSVDMGTADLPATSPPGTRWGWEAYWWDGSQWTSYAVTAYGGYNWVGYLGLVSAAASAVCA